MDKSHVVLTDNKINHFRSISLSITSLLCSVTTAAAVTLSMSGSVIDSKGSPVSGAAVVLKSDTSIKCNTGDGGEFNLGAFAVNKSSLATVNKTGLFSADISENRLNLFIHESSDCLSAAIYSVNGKNVWQTFIRRAACGLHSYNLPHFAPGIYIIKITAGSAASDIRLLSNGNELLQAGSAEVFSDQRHSGQYAASDNTDSIIVRKEGYATSAKAVLSHDQSGILIMMDLAKSVVKAVSELPEIKDMPDPLTMNNGTKVATADQWKTRRREMIQILEDYEYGHMPPPPANVKAKVTTAKSRISAGTKLEADYSMLHLTFGPDEKCGFDIGVFTPVTEMPAGGYPVLISLDYSAGKSSIGSSTAALSRGYAVVTIPYTQLGADAASWKTSAFFPFYPDYDWRDISAWAWGISRAIDYLVTDMSIDKTKIMATGTSRLGQAVLLAGAFDERVALSAPVAGGMAFRFSGKEMGGGLGQGITEIVDQNTYWFGPLLPQFKNKTPRLPSDQHWLPALTAPRLFIMCNSYSDQYGRAYAAVQTYQYALPVYKFLGVDENIGLNFREGTHGMTSEDWSALLDFSDQKLLKKTGTRKFNTIPSADKTP